jgi:hypothetical protein
MTAPLKPFVTDGCSGLFMRAVHAWWHFTGQEELSVAVRAYCVVHDEAYHPGGTAAQRVIADAELMIGVAKQGRPFLARCMIFAIGFGGHPWLPFRKWRWGYGREWPSGYD